ncbi:MAG: DUF374 domain-containing protein [Deltaproteobacteria bacterium]|nr:DUF374 domain-containing protein [Deltaproteobacteria bacterium]
MSDPARRSLKTFRRRITYSESFYQFASGLAMLLIRAYLPLLRIRKYFHPEFQKLDRNRVFYGFWHGRLLLLVPAFGPWHVTIMTDLSWAGELLARILTRFGYHVVRGSSKRGGFQGVIHMKKKVETGVSGALALDGPRGPYRESKPGVLFLSQKMDYPIVPLAFGADRYWTLNTWDRVVVPKPFARCFVGIGKPVTSDQIRQGFDVRKLDTLINDWTEMCDRKARKPSSVSRFGSRV